MPAEIACWFLQGSRCCCHRFNISHDLYERKYKLPVDDHIDKQSREYSDIQKAERI